MARHADAWQSADKGGRGRLREKELRLALVCYGGVSLAVYMHGIVKEAWKLLRASRALHDDADPAARDRLSDSERVYLDLLEALAPHSSLRVLVDIVAGASAGGINGVFLAHAIATGADMEPLRRLWLEYADIETLLDPAAAPATRFSKLYAAPLIWYAARDKATDVDRIADPKVREEVRAKLSRFIRSRWFEPPFSGEGFTRLLYDALGAMDAGDTGAPLLPPGHPLDLKLTATDFHGAPEHLAVHSPPEIVETEHRIVIEFRDDGRPAGGRSDGDGRLGGGRSSGASDGTSADGRPRCIGSRAALTFAARASASFPGAFPPFRLSELDAVLDSVGDAWPDRDAFVARVFGRRIAAGLDPAGAALIDGSVLNNAPFRPAIEALANRPAHREVDRRFVYIDPKPGGHLVGGRPPASQAPGFFTTILRSLSDIPREQPIRARSRRSTACRGASAG